MRLTSGSELQTLNKDRLETRSLSCLAQIEESNRTSPVDMGAKSLEPQFSGGALPYVPWHFIHHRPLQPVVSRHRDASDHGAPSALAGSW